MQKKTNILSVIAICITLITICFSTLIVYKTFWNVPLMPGFFIEDSIEYVNQSTNINDLKIFILNDFEIRKRNNPGREAYIYDMFFYGIVVFLSALGSLILLFILKRKIKQNNI